MLIILQRRTPCQEDNPDVTESEPLVARSRDLGLPSSYQVAVRAKSLLSLENKTMWTKPQYTEMRFGFEVTMYVAAQ